MKKVGIVSVWPLTDKSFAGTEKFVSRIAFGFALEGCEVHCFSPSRVKRYHGHIHHSLDLRISLDERFLREFAQKFGVDKLIKHFSTTLRKALVKNPVDFLIINSPVFLPSELQQRSILVIHDSPEQLKIYFGANKFVELVGLIRNAKYNAIVAPSMSSARAYRELFMRNVLCVPHSLNPKEMSMVNKQFAQVTKMGVVKILIPSRLEPMQKGQDLAVKALGKLVGNMKLKFILEMPGIDKTYLENKQMLESLAKYYKVPVKIKNFPNILREIKSSDLILLPSRFETFGYSALESLALGKKVILSDIPSYIEISKGAANAFLFKKGSVENLYTTIKRHIKDVDKNPSKIWYKRYDFNKWIKKYIELLDGSQY